MAGVWAICFTISILLILYDEMVFGLLYK